MVVEIDCEPREYQVVGGFIPRRVPSVRIRPTGLTEFPNLRGKEKKIVCALFF